jgi:alkaline phosphatase
MMVSCLLALLAAGCHSSLQQESATPEILPLADDKPQEKLARINGDKIKNIVLVIMDGVSLNQLLAARYTYYGVNGRLNMERFPDLALVNTNSADSSVITDSGAGATAMATGYKTMNGMLGVSPDGKSRENLISIFQKAGKSTALITYGGLSGATPAAFATHTDSRENKQEISKQMLASNVDYLFGDADDFIDDRINAPGGTSPQNLNGYTLWRNELPRNIPAGKNKQLVIFDSLVKEHASYTSNSVQLATNAPSLSEIVRSSLVYLKTNPAGFFMMLEEDWTDSWGHVNRAGLAAWHVKNADDALIPLIAFAQENKETLIIVTADHETGGMTIPEMNRNRKSFTVKFSTEEHTAVPVALFAYGPGAELFNGVIDNTEIFQILSSLNQTTFHK